MKLSDALYEAKGVYVAGQNIIAHFADRNISPLSKQDIVLVSYDLQSGSYSKAAEALETRALKAHVGDTLTAVMKTLGVRSLCEAGVGEATTLRFLMERHPQINYYGFDISLSRLLYARKFITELGFEIPLFSADLLDIPVADHAVDAVFSFHALEPNGGREADILAEMVRVAQRYLIMVEPDYERASAAQRTRMDGHNYVRGLRDVLNTMPGRIIIDEPWAYNSNPLNAASLIVFEKSDVHVAEWSFVSPGRKAPLTTIEGGYFCADEGLYYPSILGIPQLQQRTSLIASCLGDFL